MRITPTVLALLLSTNPAVGQQRPGSDSLPRELVVLRADFERLRVETQQQLGAKLT